MLMCQSVQQFLSPLVLYPFYTITSGVVTEEETPHWLADWSDSAWWSRDLGGQNDLKEAKTQYQALCDVDAIRHVWALCCTLSQIVKWPFCCDIKGPRGKLPFIHQPGSHFLIKLGVLFLFWLDYKSLLCILLPHRILQPLLIKRL